MSDATTARPRLLTGDTPTGRLHLGHWVGSLENRLKLQETHDCYFLIANKHAFSTRAADPEAIRQSVIDVATDWLAIGLDPERSALFVQSEVPAIDELTFFFSMLLPFNRVMRNPTLTQELKDKGLGDKHSFGFPLYAVGQTADILAFRPQVVPVGEDQAPHLEMTREVARKFNQLYCGVDPQDESGEVGVLPVPQLKVGRVGRLPGTNGPADGAVGGALQKMSKSLNNAIFLGDDPKTVKKKVQKMYTDPARVHMTDAGNPDPAVNPLFAFLRTFMPDQGQVDAWADGYRKGGETAPGDGTLKKALVEQLIEQFADIREKRAHYEARPDDVMDALKLGTTKANVVAEETLAMCKAAMKQDFFGRSLTIGG